RERQPAHLGDRQLLRRAGRPLSARLRDPERHPRAGLLAARRAGRPIVPDRRALQPARLRRRPERHEPRQRRGDRLLERLHRARVHHRPADGGGGGSEARAMKRATVLAAAVVAFGACTPDFGERASLVTKNAVLAVRGDPPDGKPGTDVTYTVLAV